MFNLKLLPRTELDCYYNDVGRIYKTPVGDLPSVTTVLGNYYDKSGLEKWRESLGHEKADKISNDCARNGTMLHGVMEKFLLNQDYSKANSIDRMRFQSVKRKLEANIKAVYGVEYPLFSKKLKTAGKTDSIINWNGYNTVLDLKTTRKYKSEKWIESYFTQTTAYSMMINESGMIDPITKIIIVFSTDDFECYYFEKNVSDYVGIVNKIFIENRCK